MSIKVIPRRGRWDVLGRSLNRKMEAGAKAMADRLEYLVSAGSSVRTGDSIGKGGRAVSRPGEWPQEQLGNLRSAAGYEPTERKMFFQVGFFTEKSDDPGELASYLGEIEGYPVEERTAASRYALQRMAQTDPSAAQETYKAIEEAIRDTKE